MKVYRSFYLIALFIFIVSLACSFGGSPIIQAGSPSASQGLMFGGKGTDPGLFNDVRGLAVNPSTGAIVAADYHDGRVQAFDPNGKFLTQWIMPGGKSAIITGMAGDSSGNVYIVTGGNIMLYDSTGQLKTTITVPDLYINNVALMSDGNLVAATAQDETIIKLSPDGKVLSTIKNAFSANDGSTELDMTVAVDSAGDIFVLGSFNNAVFKFSPDGKFISHFGSAGDAAGQFSAAEAIAVDNSGKVYVSDLKGIQVFDGDGHYLSLINVDGVARRIAFDSQNQLYFTSSKNQVFKINVPKS